MISGKGERTYRRESETDFGTDWLCAEQNYRQDPKETLGELQQQTECEF